MSQELTSNFVKTNGPALPSLVRRRIGDRAKIGYIPSPREQGVFDARPVLLHEGLVRLETLCCFGSQRVHKAMSAFLGDWKRPPK